MLQPTSPGVYVEEVSTTTPIVVQVNGSIPAFVGITALIPPNGFNTPLRITSLLQYEAHFGKAKYPNNFQIELVNNSGTLKIKQISQEPAAQQAILFYAMQLYFMNGGGPCYIVPIETPIKAHYILGIDALAAVDEVSLLVLPDACLLLNTADYHEICNSALQHCGSITNRFAILDVLDTVDGVQQFRNQVVTNLRDGAAYTPHLKTNFSFDYDENEVLVTIDAAAPVNMSTLASSSNLHYRFLKTALENSPKVTLPPSAALAGIYVRTDKERGVWKAPANASIIGITGITRAIAEDEQTTLNVDPISGKSINAIRSFPGRGILVWGARTLAGNDNEYRYVSVRRFLNVVEASVYKASRFVAFEVNEQSTWNRLKVMTENYLQTLWRAGALQGTSAEKAYFVQVGLGSTMTEQDISDGKVIIQIGLAVVRSAEFVMIKIIHHQKNPSPTDITPPETKSLTSIQTNMEWSDLIINPETKHQLMDISQWISHNNTLLNEWGLAGKVRQSFSALFYGPSGTGKTLSAALIGKSAKRSIYKVKLYEILGKYIGETEKNLDQLFQRAELQGSILFFDEADALFGKRTEVRDAHDRYANVEVSYLLQLVEKHSGLILFATNHKANIDPGFTRRLDMLVEFPMPTIDERLQLWKQNIPTKAILADTIDLKTLAEAHELTGGAILNVIYYACLQALKKATHRIEESDVLEGIRKELSKQETD